MKLASLCDAASCFLLLTSKLNTLSTRYVSSYTRLRYTPVEKRLDCIVGLYVFYQVEDVHSRTY